MLKGVKLPLLGVFACLCMSPPAARAGDAILVPEGDLPCAMVAGHRVAFTRNGAFVVCQDERWLFDGGLSYAMPGWKEWGTQIRKSGREDSWELNDVGGGELISRGTLFDHSGVRRFTFIEHAVLVPGGLRFNYEITPLEKRDLQEFGVTLHFPIAGTGNARSDFWPGFEGTLLPESYQKPVLCETRGRGATIYVLGQACAVIIGSGAIRWAWLDERAWELNTFRLVGSDDELARRLSRGDSVTFSFEVLLGAFTLKTFSLGPAHVEIDPQARAVVRASERKILEGGLARGGESVEWLFENVDAFAPPGEANQGIWRASGVSRIQETKAEYGLEVASESASANLTFRLRRIDGPWPPSELRVAFAIPASEVSSLSAEEGPTPASQAASSTNQQGGLRHLARLLCHNQIEILLYADAPWTTVQCKIGTVPCHLLATPAGKAEGDMLEVRIRLGISTAHQSGEQGT